MTRRRSEIDPVTIMINRWERGLILLYGYPFDDIEQQLLGATGFTIPRWNGLKVALPAPEIEVFNPDAPLDYYKSAYFNSGVSRLGFKSVLVGEKSIWKTLLIRNVGARDLANLKLAVVGDDSGDFIVRRLPKTKIKPGKMVALKLCFKPLKRGVKNCELRITSNDTDETQFVVPLRGVGVELIE